jgi:UMF1 family MFS transporter
MYMIAYFFYIDGVGTVIHMSTSYGTKLGLDSTGMVLALMVTQLVAVPCSIMFARLAEKIGTRKTLLAGISVYVVVCILGFYMGYSLELAEARAQAAMLSGGEAAYLAIFEPARQHSQVIFWILALLVGTSQGGMQSLSRSQFGRMIPPDRSNEFFGFFDIFGKFATVLGPFLFAFISSTTGRSSFGILSLLVLFAIGAVMLLLTSKKWFEQDYRQLFAPPAETAAEVIQG